MDITTLNADEIAQCIGELNAEDLKTQASHLSGEQLVAVTASLSTNEDKFWRDKLRALVEGLKDYQGLEKVGKALATEQGLELLNLFENALRQELWKLSPLIVGMPHTVFTEVLLYATAAQMQTLRKEAPAEPLQHQMTVLTHEVLKQINAYSLELENLEKSIQLLNIREIGHREMLMLYDAIQQAVEFFDETLEKINKLLALAWNSNRKDLIEKLSHAKELSLKILETFVGSPSTANQPPTGLYAKLEERLSLVYGDPRDPQDIEAVDDDEPAIEALVKFSLWYLHDYWNIGLLPHITDPLLLNPPPEIKPQERQSIRNRLFNQVEANLAKIGLETAADLKKAGIYSKHSLQEYIASRLHLLKS